METRNISLTIWAVWLAILVGLAVLVASVFADFYGHPDQSEMAFLVGPPIALSLLLARGLHLVAVARSPSLSPTSRSSTSGSLLVWASFALLLIFIFCFVPLFIVAISLGKSPSAAKGRRDAKRSAIYTQSIEVLRSLNRCLAAYARDHGGFPRHLKAVGPEGTSCASLQVVEDRLPEQSIAFHAAPKNRDGAITAYSIEVNSMWSDETGAIFGYIHNSGGPGEIGPMVDSKPEFLVLNLAQGAGHYRRCHPRSGYPASIAEMEDLGDAAPGEVTAGLKAGRLDGYRFIYTPDPRGPEGRIDHYRVDARPVRYGHVWTLSYMFDSEGKEWLTGQDRAAAPSDPAPVDNGRDAVRVEEGSHKQYKCPDEQRH